jgi:hypothetical protein
MTDQERSQVLKMIENGQITPEEGLHLMQALDQSPVEDSQPAPDIAAATSTSAEESGEPAHDKTSGFEVDPRIESIKSTVRRFWQIPLWIGIAITVLSALGMYAVMRGPGMNFWFYFLLLPLLLGVVVITLAVGSHRARWLFVEVKQKPGERPERIFLGFPLPLKFAAWFLRTFGGMIPGLRNNNVNIDEISRLLETGFSGQEPLIVNVDEGEGSERVKVFIG